MCKGAHMNLLKEFPSIFCNTLNDDHKVCGFSINKLFHSNPRTGRFISSFTCQESCQCNVSYIPQMQRLWVLGMQNIWFLNCTRYSICGLSMDCEPWTLRYPASHLFVNNLHIFVWHSLSFVHCYERPITKQWSYLHFTVEIDKVRKYANGMLLWCKFPWITLNWRPSWKIVALVFK